MNDDDVNPEWVREVREQIIEPMRDSAMVVPIFTGDVDWKIALEMGAAVLLDKPVIVCVSDRSVAVPANLSRIARKILVLSDPDFHDQLQAVLRTEGIVK